MTTHKMLDPDSLFFSPSKCWSDTKYLYPKLISQGWDGVHVAPLTCSVAIPCGVLCSASFIILIFAVLFYFSLVIYAVHRLNMDIKYLGFCNTCFTFFQANMESIMRNRELTETRMMQVCLFISFKPKTCFKWIHNISLMDS